jgi:pentatricopeptide repeat protein
MRCRALTTSQLLRAALAALVLHLSAPFIVRPYQACQHLQHRRMCTRASALHAQADLAAMTEQRRSEIIKRAQVKDWEGAPAVLAAMVAEDVPRDVACYAGVIRACSICARPDEALDTFSQMQEEGIPASTAAYNAAIVGCIGKHAH